MRKTFYKISSDRFDKDIRLALVSDLHAQSYKQPMRLVKEESPDYILFGGDIFEALDGTFEKKNSPVFPILKEAVNIAPTFYSTGNHEDGAVHSHLKSWKDFESIERKYTKESLKLIKDSGVNFLINAYKVVDGIAFGGLASGLINKNGIPELEFLREFAALDMPKILICHHPEYYEKYIRELPIDIIVSGHAHGGQWRIFGQGIYAPGQGLFPKYTSGVHENRLVISKGLRLTFVPPRIFNPREVVIIDIEGKNKK